MKLMQSVLASLEAVVVGITLSILPGCFVLLNVSLSLPVRMMHKQAARTPSRVASTPRASARRPVPNARTATSCARHRTGVHRTCRSGFPTGGGDGIGRVRLLHEMTPTPANTKGAEFTWISI